MMYLLLFIMIYLAAGMSLYLTMLMLLIIYIITKSETIGKILDFLAYILECLTFNLTKYEP